MGSTSRRKNKKQRKGEGEGEGNSNESGMGMRICDLPDPILHRILSSLPTKEVIRTSVLSKRWEHLWKNMSKIELMEDYRTHLQEPEPEKRRQKFMNFAMRLLAACDCSRLKEFSLSCRVGQNATQVSHWLYAFINPKIEFLSLQFEEIPEPLVFPDHLFTCATLTAFLLYMPHIFKLPSSIHFQSLRTLVLFCVIFPDSASTQDLFSGCPALEDLSLVSCNLKNVKAFFISCPLLKKIKIEMEDKEEVDDDLNFSNRCKVVIIGTKLKSFHYKGDCSDEYLLYDSASVINVSIKVQAPPERFWDEDYGFLLDLGYYVFKLLKELPNVEKLSISHASTLALSRTGLLLTYAFFPTCLSYPGLLAMFHYSPNLEVIRFEGGVSLPKDDTMDILDCIPLCFSTGLKTIEICDFNGEEEELFAIKVLLQAASSLGKLIIWCYSRSSDFDDIDSHQGERSEKLHKQILRYPKRSMDCEIDFQHIMR